MTELSPSPPRQASILPAFLRDGRIIAGVLQFLFLIATVVILSQLGNQINSSLPENQKPNFDFFQNRAGFALADAGDYTPDDSYQEAFWVGVINTLRIVLPGLVATTLLGIVFGIFLLSNNWLLRTLARAYVELLRNTPILLQIIAWFFIVIFAFPALDEAIEVPTERVVQSRDLIRYLLYIILGLIYWFGLVRSRPRGTWHRPLLIAVLPIALIFTEINTLAGRNDIENEQWVALLQGAVILLGVIGLILSVIPEERRKNLLPIPEAMWRFRFSLIGLLIGWIVAIPLSGFFATLVDLAIGLLGIDGSFAFFPVMLISIKGVALPELVPTSTFPIFLGFLAIGGTVAYGAWVYLGNIIETTGRPINRGNYVVLALLGFMLLGWFFTAWIPQQETIVLSETGESVLLQEAYAEGTLSFEEEIQYANQPLLYAPPRRNARGTAIERGIELQAPYLAVFLGLVVYTSAFIAEIVRAGIQAVPKGQTEASRAVGLSGFQMLRLIILPQALRVIIPPMGNQYLNFTKNSSLAIAVSYTDLFQVMNTTINQSGQSVTGIFIVLLTYLVMSLTISVMMNAVNQRFQLVTR